MRILCLIIVLSASSAVFSQDSPVPDAVAARKQYQADLQAARDKYVEALEELAKKSLADDKLDEAIALKKQIEDLKNPKAAEPARSDNKPEPKVLWKHGGGYFEQLNDGYWIERVPNGVAHLFAVGTSNKDYIEISRTTGSKTIVRLYDDHCTVLFQGKPGFKPLYKGRWVKRN